MTAPLTAVRPDPAAAVASVAARAPRRRVAVDRVAGLGVIVAMLAFGVYSLTTLDFTTANLSASITTAVRTFSLMDPISLPGPADLAYLIGLTVGIVILGTLLAALLSVPVAWIAADSTTPAGWLRWVGRAIGVITRAVPDVVLALAFALTFTLGSPLPGIFAMGIHSIGMISKLFADAIERADDGPRLAIRAAGGGRAQEFWAGVFPQVLPSWIATVLLRFDINLRGSAILGYAGVGGLGYAMRVAFQQFPTGYGRGLGLAAVIFVLCVVLEIVSSTVRRTLLGVDPVGVGIGDRVLRAVTRSRRATRRVRPTAAAGAARVDTADVGTAGTAGTAGTVHTVGLAGTRPARSSAAGHSRSVEAMLRRPWTADRIRNASWTMIAVALIIASWWWADVDFSQITWEYLVPTLQSFWPPTVGSHTFGEFAQGMLVTIQVAFAAALLSLVISLVIGSLAARNVAPSGRVRSVFRFVLVIFRGVPELVLAIFLIMITGLGNQAGVVALAFGGIGVLGKLIADSFEEVPHSLERAVTATGATRAQRFFAATWPVGLPSLIGNSIYLVDTNIRAATLLGIVGGGGVGFYITQASTVLQFHGQVTVLVAMVFITVLVIEGIAAWLRRVYR
ncbi:PhnE/PtxC family ABC transporter permease [Raineyella sp. LH-20]|uniref:PhnE/PtxC family ABC transporter permease n=1 Tax=Raineyella sp. LH-20 TaxID=3081204 RepID=UPI002954F32E|nr:ABC transporter permease subunit [Raineyella sp. LH-20]WOP18811.1 ABC transporter permease subunit [Raineyella sp. LH-20]